MQAPDGGNAREAIGERIIETPTSLDGYQYNNDRARYIAYVPTGSTARGAVIATKGEDAAAACESCHGANLQDAGVMPPLAVRSPTYIVRELILFRAGKRSNPGAAPMRLEASRLSVRDRVAVAAYAASRKPRCPAKVHDRVHRPPEATQAGGVGAGFCGVRVTARRGHGGRHRGVWMKSVLEPKLSHHIR